METDFKVYKHKIDIYVSKKYACSTNASKTCKEAKIKYCLKYGIDPLVVKTIFAR